MTRKEQEAETRTAMVRFAWAMVGSYVIVLYGLATNIEIFYTAGGVLFVVSLIFFVVALMLRLALWAMEE